MDGSDTLGVRPLWCAAMANRVAVITGASSGIGEATAKALAGAGFAVAVAARRSDRISALADEISGDGGRALAVPTDVADPESARNLIQVAKDELGSVDVLLNNAG